MCTASSPSPRRAGAEVEEEAEAAAEEEEATSNLCNGAVPPSRSPLAHDCGTLSFRMKVRMWMVNEKNLLHLQSHQSGGEESDRIFLCPSPPPPFPIFIKQAHVNISKKKIMFFVRSALEPRRRKFRRGR